MSKANAATIETATEFLDYGHYGLNYFGNNNLDGVLQNQAPGRYLPHYMYKFH